MLYLLKTAHIRLDATLLGIAQVKMFSTFGKVVFAKPEKFDLQKLIKLIKNKSNDFKLTKYHDLQITKVTKTAEQRIDFVENFLKGLS